MPTIVVCPKCQARYQLPETMLGKTIQCKKCSSQFSATANQASPKAAATGKPGSAKEATRESQSIPVSRYSTGAPAEELARFGISGPLVRQADPMAENLAPPPKDILGNFATDPGFVMPELADDDQQRSSTNGLDVVIENPFVAEAASLARSEHYDQGDGFGYSDLKSATGLVIFSYIVMTLAVAVSFVTPIVFVAMGTQATEETAAQVGLIMFIASIIFWIALPYYHLAGSLFSYQGHENLSNLGVKEAKWNRVFAGFAWFIPFANFVIPLLTTIELVRESDRFAKKKTGSGKLMGLVWGWWIATCLVWVAFITYGVLALIAAVSASFESVASATLAEGFILLVIFTVIILGLMITSIVLLHKVGLFVSSEQEKQWKKLRKSKKLQGHASATKYPPVYVGIATLMASVPLCIFGVLALIFGTAGIVSWLEVESPAIGWVLFGGMIVILLIALGIGIKGLIILIKGLVGKPRESVA